MRSDARPAGSLALCVAGFAFFLWSVSTIQAQQGSQPAAQPQQGTLAGTWTGRYLYPDARQSVEFVFVFETDTCRGRSEEPNTFGDASAPKLSPIWHANSLLISPGQNFVISKTYDGTGKVSHPVIYSGTMSADLSEITGEWSIDRMRGTFSMRRQ